MWRFVGRGLLGASLAAMAGACGTPIPAGYPDVRGPETAFDLVVDGTGEQDTGPTGTLLIDDGVAAHRHYLIPAMSTIAVVPSLDVGSYVAPDPNVRLDLLLGSAFDAESLRISVDGNRNGYVWGSLDAVLSHFSASGAPLPKVHVTGRFAAGIE